MIMDRYNEELKEIMAYLKEVNPSIEEKRFLIEYLTRSARKNYNKPEKYSVNVKSLMKDVQVLNDKLSLDNDTNLLKSRLSKEIDLLNGIIKLTENEDFREMNKISYELDRLYIDSDMPLRNTDTVIKAIRDSKGKGVSR